jgi:hypothetical protein
VFATKPRTKHKLPADTMVLFYIVKRAHTVDKSVVRFPVEALFFFGGLFNGCFSIDTIKRRMTDELEMIWKEAIVT